MSTPRPTDVDIVLLYSLADYVSKKITGEHFLATAAMFDKEDWAQLYIRGTLYNHIEPELELYNLITNTASKHGWKP